MTAGTVLMNVQTYSIRKVRYDQDFNGGSSGRIDVWFVKLSLQIVKLRGIQSVGVSPSLYSLNVQQYFQEKLFERVQSPYDGLHFLDKTYGNDFTREGSQFRRSVVKDLQQTNEVVQL